LKGAANRGMRGPLERTLGARGQMMAALLLFGWAVMACAATGVGQQAAPAIPVRSVGGAASPAPGAAAGARPVSQRGRVAAQEYFLRGAKDFEHNHLAAAEREFKKAASLDPANARYAASAEIARQYQVSQLVARASQERAHQQSDAANAALAEAKRMDPANAPIALEPRPGRQSFHLRLGTGALIQQVTRSFGIEADTTNLGERPQIPFDVTDVDFAEAEHLLALVTDSFFVPVDTKHVLAASDTPEHRKKYARELAETLDCPGMSDKELADLETAGRMIFDKGEPVVRDSREHIVMRGTANEIEAMNEACSEFSEGHSEVQVDVQIYEVDRNHENDSGVELPNTATLFNVRSEIDSIIANNESLVEEIISEGLASAGDYSEILAILLASGELSGTVFNSPFVLFGGGLTETGAAWNSTTANMLLNSTDVKSLNQIQMRLLDQQEGKFVSGEKYPIITSTYTGETATSSSTTSSTSIPEVQYTDLGLALKVKPQVESRNDILLSFDLEITSLEGSSVDDDPIINDRKYTSMLTVKPGQSALIASVMSKQDSLQITGIPGLSDIPGFSSATNRDDTVTDAELVVLITPRIVRYAHRDLAGRRMMLSLR
jgi:general secretion pathway protein D